MRLWNESEMLKTRNFCDLWRRTLYMKENQSRVWFSWRKDKKKTWINNPCSKDCTACNPLGNLTPTTAVGIPLGLSFSTTVLLCEPIGWEKARVFMTVLQRLVWLTLCLLWSNGEFSSLAARDFLENLFWEFGIWSNWPLLADTFEYSHHLCPG